MERVLGGTNGVISIAEAVVVPDGSAAGVTLMSLMITSTDAGCIAGADVDVVAASALVVASGAVVVTGAVATTGTVAVIGAAVVTGADSTAATASGCVSVTGVGNGSVDASDCFCSITGCVTVVLVADAAVAVVVDMAWASMAADHS